MHLFDGGTVWSISRQSTTCEIVAPQSLNTEVPIGGSLIQHLQNRETMERHRIDQTGVALDAVGSFIHLIYPKLIISD